MSGAGCRKAAARPSFTSSRVLLVTKPSGNLKRLTPSLTTVISWLPTLSRYQPAFWLPAAGMAAEARGIGPNRAAPEAAIAPATTLRRSRLVMRSSADQNLKDGLWPAERPAVCQAAVVSQATASPAGSRSLGPDDLAPSLAGAHPTGGRDRRSGHLAPQKGSPAHGCCCKPDATSEAWPPHHRRPQPFEGKTPGLRPGRDGRPAPCAGRP